MHHLEIEIKLKVPDLPRVRNSLPGMGFTILDKRQFERNILFDTPELTLASRHELLRLRRFGKKNTVTFKQPSVESGAGGTYKINREIESGFTHFDRMKSIFLGLGYQMVWVYEKYRETWRRGAVTVFLDETPIGDFMEIEASECAIDELARMFGYSREDYIARNYRRLFIESGCRGDMVFKK